MVSDYPKSQIIKNGFSKMNWIEITYNHNFVFSINNHFILKKVMKTHNEVKKTLIYVGYSSYFKSYTMLEKG